MRTEVESPGRRRTSARSDLIGIAKEGHATPNDDVYYGGIRIDVAGREPRGTVHRGAELDRLCAQLADALHALVNLETRRGVRWSAA